MINLTPEERETGRENYYSAVTAHEEHNRRDFLVRSIAAGGVAAAGIGGMYFGYGKPSGPVRVCVIGTGDEGSVLMGAINPEYVRVTAICDIRPSSVHRAFHGDWSTDNTIKVRPGLMSVYGWKTETEARENVSVYQDWQEAVQDPNIDGVIIATPLFLHAPIAIAAMQAGKHVLCEKLMAHNIAQCKLMTRTANETNTLLSVGHQPGGEIAASGERVDKIRDQLGKFQNAYRTADPKDRKKLAQQIAQWEKWDMDKTVDAEKYGYISRDDVYGGGRIRSAREEMVRWRLWDRTGGGLMAELGSHQLDAASIFISALSKKTDKHVHPLTVHAVGGRHIFPKDRDADDHVYCSFEFPGQGYDYNFDVGYRDSVNNFPSKQNPVPAYDSSDNKFGGYGEVVLGTKGTLVLDREKEVMLYPIKGTSYKARVKKKGASAILDTSASGDAAPAKAAEGGGPVSRGYREQIEHWAWCISTGDFVENQPRCNGPVALADAVIALTAKQAIANSQKKGGNGYIEFQPGWFDVASDEVPEADGAEATKKMWAKEKKELGC